MAFGTSTSSWRRKRGYHLMLFRTPRRNQISYSVFSNRLSREAGDGAGGRSALRRVGAAVGWVWVRRQCDRPSVYFEWANRKSALSRFPFPCLQRYTALKRCNQQTVFPDTVVDAALPLLEKQWAPTLAEAIVKEQELSPHRSVRSGTRHVTARIRIRFKGTGIHPRSKEGLKRIHVIANRLAHRTEERRLHLLQLVS